MIITEPATLLTDYFIALEAIAFSVGLRNASTLPGRLWAVTFAAVAIAAGLGGTCHGFVNSLGDFIPVLWRIMLYAISTASLLMLGATGIAVLPRSLHGWVWAGAGAKWLLWLGWEAQSGDYSLAAIDYLTTMVMVMGLNGLALAREIEPIAARWAIGGVGVSWLAIGIQVSGWQALGLNSNDFYHLVQMAALYLFYSSAKFLKGSL